MKRLMLNLSMIGEKKTGLGVYAMECTRALLQLFEMEIVVPKTNTFEWGNNRIYKSYDQIVLGKGKCSSLFRLLYLSLLFPRIPNRFIFTPTHHGIPGYRDQVITIHDLIALQYPEQNRAQYYYYRYVLPRIVQNCKAIFTVSNTIAEEVAHNFKLSSNVIYVVPNCVDQNVPIQNSPDREEPFLLCVGAAYSHKNIHSIFQYKECWQHRYRLKIVSAQGRYRDYLYQEALRLNIIDKVDIEGYVSEGRLNSLYQKCSALIYPSLSEGFGIPPLEAIARSCLVIVSDIPVFHEILGNAAIYFQLGDATSFKRAVEILDNPIKSLFYKENGKKILQKYNFEHLCECLKNALLDVEPTLLRKNNPEVINKKIQIMPEAE